MPTRGYACIMVTALHHTASYFPIGDNLFHAQISSQLGKFILGCRIKFDCGGLLATYFKIWRGSDTDEGSYAQTYFSNERLSLIFCIA